MFEIAAIGKCNELTSTLRETKLINFVCSANECQSSTKGQQVRIKLSYSNRDISSWNKSIVPFQSHR